MRDKMFPNKYGLHDFVYLMQKYMKNFKKVFEKL